MVEEKYLGNRQLRPPEYFIDSAGKKIPVRDWRHLSELERQNRDYQETRAVMDEQGD